ncbi:hypothetical protein MLD38_040681 [Melastoma candidum]|nr:hypothetical protein MLD38_040681 [Melastoma candidum]
MAGQMEVLNALDVAKTQWYHFRPSSSPGWASSPTPMTSSVFPCHQAPRPLVLQRPGFGQARDPSPQCLSGRLSFGHTAKSVMATLCFFRFWLGFGIGGDYPLSATIMSEYANKKTRGAFIAAVFAMQGFGILAGGMVAIVISGAFNAHSKPRLMRLPVGSTVPQADYVWRIILMAGAISGYGYLLLEDEDARDSPLHCPRGQEHESGRGRYVQEQFGLFSRSSRGSTGFTFSDNHHVVLARHCILQPEPIPEGHLQRDRMDSPSEDDERGPMRYNRIARAQTLIALCSTVPGYWFTVALIDKIGRLFIQLIGFFFMTVFMFALAIIRPLDSQGESNRLCRVRSPREVTVHLPRDICSVGKARAIIGAFGFLYLAQNKDKSKADAGYPAGIGVRNSLIVLGGINFLGLLFTFLVPESKGKSLEEMSGEDGGGMPETADQIQGNINRTAPVP